jgi:hypothetical protein
MYGAVCSYPQLDTHCHSTTHVLLLPYTPPNTLLLLGDVLQSLALLDACCTLFCTAVAYSRFNFS